MLANLPRIIIKRFPVLDLDYLGAILPLSDHPIGCFTLGLNTLVNGTVAAAAVGSATMLLDSVESRDLSLPWLYFFSHRQHRFLLPSHIIPLHTFSIARANAFRVSYVSCTVHR